MPRHIHVHLHQHAPSTSAQDQGAAGPSTTPKRPPSTVIKPTPQTPHNPPRPRQTKIKPLKPAGVIKGQRGTNVVHPVVRGAAQTINTATKGVKGVNRILRGVGRIASEDAVQHDPKTGQFAAATGALQKSGYKHVGTENSGGTQVHSYEHAPEGARVFLHQTEPPKWSHHPNFGMQSHNDPFYGSTEGTGVAQLKSHLAKFK